MALQLPPAVSINGFTGGYVPDADYLSLGESETANSRNVNYTVARTLEKRKGSKRMLTTTMNGSAANNAITGHYYFEKLGTTSTFHVVAENGSLYQYSSAAASAIVSGLNSSSETYWNFIQLQDFRSPADDIILGTNGVDKVHMWNGSGSAIPLTESAVTSATQVAVVKKLLFHQERVYGIGVIDATDADAGVKVFRSGFGTDGLADPHRWTENFYVGGSSKDGKILNSAILDNQIVFYKKRAIWKFNPGSGGIGDLIVAKDDIGLYAEHTLIDVGDFHIFLSERGIYAFDGNQTIRLSEKQDIKLFAEANLTHLYKAKAIFDETNEHYILYYPKKTETRNDTAIVYDLKLKIWQPPITGKRVSFLSTFTNELNREQVIYGDYHGYLYKDNQGTADGVTNGFNFTPTSASSITITNSSSDTSLFTTTGDGLRGHIVRVIDGLGDGEERVIESNTSETLTLENAWGLAPNTASTLTVGGIDSFWQGRDNSFGAEDIRKMFRSVRVKAREVGDYNLTLRYMIDFHTIDQGIKALVSMFEDGFAWDSAYWDLDRWDGRQSIKKIVSIRNNINQMRIGTHIALAVENRKANEPFTLQGFDIVAKGVGKSWR